MSSDKYFANPKMRDSDIWGSDVIGFVLIIPAQSEWYTLPINIFLLTVHSMVRVELDTIASANTRLSKVTKNTYHTAA